MCDGEIETGSVLTDQDGSKAGDGMTRGETFVSIPTWGVTGMSALRRAPWWRNAPGALSERRIPLNYFDAPVHSPPRGISKTARISTQAEFHVSDRQEGRSGRKVANKKGNKTHPKMSVGREAALLRPYHRRPI